MRYVYVVLITLLLSMTLAFSIQNMATVTISFLNTSATLPLAALVAVVYVAGLITGGSVTAIARPWLRRVARRSAGSVSGAR